MKNELITLITLIFSIAFVSSITIFSGETITLELDKPYSYYSIVGNSTEVILDVTQEGNNVTITPNKYMKNDSFEIIFFDKEKEVITVYQSSGGGGSRTKYVDRNVTQYVDRDVIKYEDKIVEKEVPKETIKEVSKTSIWTWILGLMALVAVIYSIITFFIDRNNRENKDDEENKYSYTSERGF